MKTKILLISLIVLSACSHPHDVTDEILSPSDSISIDSITDSPQRIGIKMHKKSGVYEIPCVVN